MSEKKALVMSKKQHAISFLLPLIVLIIAPWFLMWLSMDTTIGWSILWPIDLLALMIGFLILFAGLLLLAVCVRMFSTIGKGTLAPWAPTQKLVIVGVYRYMRNPMITGVLLGLLGESILFSNTAIFLWFLFFFLGNHIYFIKSEEPGLLKRFGKEYATYFENVPRWLPRRTPWTMSGAQDD
ncbi:MAG: methyltransferase family protein [Candidatus Thorarchaeota archaeon SMTZ1-45]